MRAMGVAKQVGTKKVKYGLAYSEHINSYILLKSRDSYDLLYTGITDRLIALNNTKCRKYPSCAMSFASIKSVSYFSGKTAERERTTVR